MILQPVVGAGSSVSAPVVEQLQGTKNGSNSIFTSTKKFLHNSTTTALVIWGGRTLTLDSDYVVSEGGGPGTGYDTFTLSPWAAEGLLPGAGDSLFALYFQDPNFL